MTKREACEFLGKSARSVVDYVKAGRLSVEYVSGRTGRQAVFHRAEVERLKRDIETPLVRQGFATLAARNDETENGVTDSRLIRDAPLAARSLAEMFRAALPQSPAPKPWLDLKGAVEYSGLPASYLLSQARAGKPWAINVGSEKQARWRFNRDALAATA